MQTPAFVEQVRELVGARRLPVQVPSLLATRIDLGAASGLLLTDDYAPFDVLMGRETLGTPSAAP
jgi:hypothetical protein